MKYLVGLCFTLLVSHNVFATNLCNDSCALTITFPDGGSIEAVEALTITFGAGGELNLGATGTINTSIQPVSTDFSAGGVLALEAGESITFDNNASVMLGTGGNLDHVNMTLSSTGGASLTAVAGTESIVIENLTISGGLNITFYASNITVNGDLTIHSGSTLALITDTLTIIGDTDTLSTSVCSVSDASNDVTISAGTISTTDTCADISSTLSLETGVLTVGTIDANVDLTTTGSITLTPDLNDSIVITDIDESTITKTDSKNSGGAIGFYWMLLIPYLFYGRRNKAVNYGV